MFLGARPRRLLQFLVDVVRASSVRVSRCFPAGLVLAVSAGMVRGVFPAPRLHHCRELVADERLPRRRALPLRLLQLLVDVILAPGLRIDRLGPPCGEWCLSACFCGWCWSWLGGRSRWRRDADFRLSVEGLLCGGSLPCGYVRFHIDVEVLPRDGVGALFPPLGKWLNGRCCFRF